MMRAFCAAIIAIGMGITIYTVPRYGRLYGQIRKETYETQRYNQITSLITLVLMCFFVLGYAAGLTHVLTAEIGPLYGLVSTIFFLVSVYLFFSVEAQLQMNSALREKSMEVVRTFVNAIDTKDTYTKGHSRQVYNLVSLIFEHLDPQVRSGINRAKLLDAAILHDIGKIAIVDDVLSKSGPLAPQEWDQIKMHPANGKRMLDETVFRDISTWVLYHHERMDGKGYYNIPGESIPIESRIIAVADTYCALCTDRVYRPRRTYAAATAIMRASSGDQLDSSLVDIFLSLDPEALEAALSEF